jgi:hypothetical protein
VEGEDASPRRSLSQKSGQRALGQLYRSSRGPEISCPQEFSRLRDVPARAFGLAFRQTILGQQVL